MIFRNVLEGVGRDRPDRNAVHLHVGDLITGKRRDVKRLGFTELDDFRLKRSIGFH